MSRRSAGSATAAWTKALKSTVRAITRATKKVAPVAPRAKSPKAKAALKKRAVPTAQTGLGDWLPGFSMGTTGARRYWLFRPNGVKAGERLPLLVMLHGCTQDAKAFAASTRMNALARRERFMVLYPEQSRLDNPQRCWNWYDTRGAGAQRESDRIMAAIDQVRSRQAIDGARTAVLGLSAGASMAALLATRFPTRFQAVVMHSGVGPGMADSTATALAAMRGQRQAKAHQPGQAPEPWPPLMVIQGENDHIVSPRNGLAAAQSWADSVGAGSGVQRTVQRGQRYPMTVTDFKQRGRTLVTLIAVSRLGHAWSGGAANQAFSDPKGPDATGMAWTFISRQIRQLPPADTRTRRAAPRP